MTRRSTPTDIATASTNAVLDELKPRKQGRAPEKTGTNFHIKPKTPCQPQRGRSMVLTSDEVMEALGHRKQNEETDKAKKLQKTLEKERKTNQAILDKIRKDREKEEKKKRKEAEQLEALALKEKKKTEKEKKTENVAQLKKINQNRRSSSESEETPGKRPKIGPK